MDSEPAWFHMTTHTYGAWLYGDPRGFRTRHHREHVEGDYKHRPPSGQHQSQYDRSKRLMKQPAVTLSTDWRRIIGEALLERFLELGAEVISIAMGGQHAHVQTRMPPACPRAWMGFAKKHAWHVARDRNWQGLLWSKRSKATPIKDRGHQENTFDYILRHRHEGAWVWCFRDPLPPKSPPVATGGL